MQITVERPYVVESKPATEWLLGGPVQKVSPRYTHARLQTLLARLVSQWAIDRGRVGTEWRFWITPTGEAERYLVPDVAFASYERLPRDAGESAEEPHLAPDVAIEIQSPSDRNIVITHKVDIYLRSGTRLVLIVDAASGTVTAHDTERVTVFTSPETFEHEMMPDFTFGLAELFTDPNIV